MKSSITGSDHKLFLIASFFWVFSYVLVCLIVVDPWNLTFLHAYNDAFLWIFIAIAVIAMAVAGLWGLREIQLSAMAEASPGKQYQFHEFENAKSDLKDKSHYLSVF